MKALPRQAPRAAVRLVLLAPLVLASCGGGGAPNHTLTVAKSGSGSGIVTGGGIDCGSTCSVIVPSGTSITLTATAASGSALAGWSGCDSTSGASCTVGVSSDKTVTARFVETLTVTTLAGAAGVAGSTDGTGAAARFDHPYGVAVDGNGNVYVADTMNHTIRKVTPAGVVSTFAGTAAVAGTTDGTGAAARFYGPQGVAVDGNGNVYVADTGNDTIRKVTPAAVVSTLAGSPRVPGSADGTGGAARFNFPASVAADGSGNVYVADTNNQTIRKVTPAAVVSTLAGTAGVLGDYDGTGAAASFTFPLGVAVDGAGNVYVADSGNNTIRKVTPAGVVTTLAGRAPIEGWRDGTGDGARFDSPLGVAADGSGNVYVADGMNHAIRKVTPAGVVSTLAGSAPGSADGTGYAAQFNRPAGVAVDGSGNVYVADTLNNTIRKGIAGP